MGFASISSSYVVTSDCARLSQDSLGNGLRNIWSWSGEGGRGVLFGGRSDSHVAINLSPFSLSYSTDLNRIELKEGKKV